MTARAVLRSTDGKLRAPWRLLIFAVVSFIFIVIAQAVVSVAIPGEEPEVLAAEELVSGRAIAFYWSVVLAFLGAHAIVLRYVEHRPWDFVWMNREAGGPRPLGTGLLIGALAVGVPSALLLALGWLDVTDAPGTWAADALAVSMFLLPAAFVEELMVRGYPLAVLRETLGAGWALLITSVTFGLLHAFNANVTVRALALVTIAGIFLGVIVLEKRSLFAATAAHFAWNAVLAVVLHSAVSGEDLPGGDYRVVDDGPDWATGGGWGPEGGAGAVAGMLVATALLLRRYRRTPASVP
ncbi:MAG: lysostaphin resistance A-like protein [Gemmatimonadaceae bacterium]